MNGQRRGNSKEQTAMGETGSLRDLRPSVLRTECDNDDERKGVPVTRTETLINLLIKNAHITNVHASQYKEANYK